MLFYLKRTIERQILLLLSLAVLAWGGSILLDVHPRFRGSAAMMLRGGLGGLLCLAVTVSLVVVWLLVPRCNGRNILKAGSEALADRSLCTIFGAALTAATGEELLFRGVLFSAAARFNFHLALAGTFVLMALLHLRTRKDWPLALLKGMECTLYAYMYFNTRSLCMVGVAHFINEMLSVKILRSPQLQRVLSARIGFRAVRRRMFPRIAS